VPYSEEDKSVKNKKQKTQKPWLLCKDEDWLRGAIRFALL